MGEAILYKESSEKLQSQMADFGEMLSTMDMALLAYCESSNRCRGQLESIQKRFVTHKCC